MKKLRLSPIITVVPFMVLLAMAVLSGCKKDEDPGVPPEVASTNPASNATGVALNHTVSASFSVPMNASVTTQITLKQGVTAIAGTAVSGNTSVTFSPAASLLPNTLYTVTIDKGARDEAGTSMQSDYVWSFTTGAAPDVIKPTLTLSNPLNNATDVSINHTVVITFSEPIDQSTITASTFSVNQGTTVVPGVITTTSTTATFTPSSNLTAGKVYIATITTGTKDMAGNALATNQTVTFTTVSADTTLPTITSTDPSVNATGVARNKTISLVFSEAMDPLTITSSTLTLMQGATAIAGAVAYSGTTATFTPSTILTANIEYTASISTGAKDVAGNALASSKTWSFTTSGTALTLAAVELGTAANYVILAKTAINNGPTSAITGDLGLSPAATSYITGFALTNAIGYATSSQVTGNIYAADMVTPTPINLTTAVNDMVTAYNSAAGRPSPDFSELGVGNIGGKTLAPGLYKWTNNVTLPSDVTIAGSATDVWIFQIAGNLTMSSAVKVTLTGGAQAKNIFWQVAGQATLGTTAHIEGIILSMTGITFQTGASINGRALAQTAVILDSNAVIKPN